MPSATAPAAEGIGDLDKRNNSQCHQWWIMGSNSTHLFRAPGSDRRIHSSDPIHLIRPLLGPARWQPVTLRCFFCHDSATIMPTNLLRFSDNRDMFLLRFCHDSVSILTRLICPTHLAQSIWIQLIRLLSPTHLNPTHLIRFIWIRLIWSDLSESDSWNRP